MRILVVSDIHANWPALAAIDEPHDVCLCLGDLVDYGPDPVPLRAVGHGTRHLRDPGQPRPRRRPGHPGHRRDGLPLPDPGLPALDVGRAGPDERRYLLQLPVTQRLTLGGKRFLLVHATPRDPLDEYLLQGPRRSGPSGSRTSRPTSSAWATRTCSSTSRSRARWCSTRAASACLATATPAPPTRSSTTTGSS